MATEETRQIVEAGNVGRVVIADDRDLLADYMLTTVDNPFDPFEQWDEWYSFDASHGYHTPSLLARVLVTSNELSEADQALDLHRAMDWIVSENPSGMHKKVGKK